MVMIVMVVIMLLVLPFLALVAPAIPMIAVTLDVYRLLDNDSPGLHVHWTRLDVYRSGLDNNRSRGHGHADIDIDVDPTSHGWAGRKHDDSRSDKT